MKIGLARRYMMKQRGTVKAVRHCGEKLTPFLSVTWDARF
jgi:hypothetical protein